MKLIILAVTIMYFAPLWGQDPVVDASKYQLVPTVETVKAESFAEVSYLEIVGKHEGWMNLAGIPPSDWFYANYIISNESGWNPCAYYPGQSDCNASPTTACGLVQQNPCGKIPGDWRDPIAALKWQKDYVVDRYGSYQGAYNYWLIHEVY